MRPCLTQEEIVHRFQLVHGSRYDYSDMVYLHMHKHVSIKCPDHGEFLQMPAAHLKAGCNECFKTRKSNEMGFGKVGFIQKATAVHGSRYSYACIDYKNIKIKVNIICGIHGSFYQQPEVHLNGSGCPECSGKMKLTREEFIKRANIVHEDRYCYEKVNYLGLEKKVIIGCYEHGEYHQMPCNHLAGNGCRTCSKVYGRKENDWLLSMGIARLPLIRQVYLTLADGNYIIADGYDPSTNTVYEFWGNMWHGNPRVYNQDGVNPVTKTTYRELYEKTLKKKDAIVQSGYNLIDIWEDEWDIRNQD